MSSAQPVGGFLHRCLEAKLPWLLAFALTSSFAPITSAQAPEPNEDVILQARELYSLGSEHARNGDWKRAHVSLKLSFDLVRHWSTAASLGQCELELGHHADAATHLEYAVNAMSFDEEQRQQVEAMLRRARAHVASLDVQVNLNGATVSVDGKTIGKSPLSMPVFVSPGEHVVTARLDGRPDASERVVVDAGDRRTLALALGAPVPANASSKPAAPVRADVSRDDSVAATPPSKWIVVGTGAGLTVLAAGAAVVFRTRASKAESEADALGEGIGTSGCYKPTGALVGTCENLRSLIDDRNENARYSTAAWVSAGVLGAATVATWLLWPNESESDGRVSVGVSPSPGTTGLVVRTTF